MVAIDQEERMSRWDTEVARAASEDEARAIGAKLTHAKISYVVSRHAAGDEFVIKVQAADLSTAQLSIRFAGKAGS
jgi:hypothetical protein